MNHGDGGKGSGRRNEDSQAVRDGWDRIFGNKKEQQTMNDDYEHDDDETIEDFEDDEGRICPVCRGHMVVTATGMYMFCDTCGHREELDNDDYL
jgi:hypothetical protein